MLGREANIQSSGAGGARCRRCRPVCRLLDAAKPAIADSTLICRLR